jgi:hypothetical protein
MVLERFGSDRPVVGMVHLPPLPGAPRSQGDRESVRERARRDARALADGGVDGVVVENFGDAPFYPDEVPPHVVASMTDLVRDVVETVDLPVGVNVLRNDATAALSVAAAAGGQFVRVNVHTGARVTDQGVLTGRAHETVRLRDRLEADVDVFADVAVKHSSSLGERRPLDERAAEALGRGLADALVVSGPGTGRTVDWDALETVADVCTDRGAPVFVGSGVTADTVSRVLSVADGVVVGTALEEDGETAAPVDEERVASFVTAARE